MLKSDIELAIVIYGKGEAGLLAADAGKLNDIRDIGSF